MCIFKVKPVKINNNNENPWKNVYCAFAFQ